MIQFSLIDRSTFPILLVPDIEYITKFVKGDLGISDKIYTNTVKTLINTTIKTIPNIIPDNTPTKLSKNKPFGNFNPLSTIKKIDVAKTILNSFSIDTTNIITDQDLNNFLNNETIIAPENEGLKPLEKSMFQSIFDTQKPYMEVAKILVEQLVRIEDLIAVLLSVGGKSLKPKYNPKALGYSGNEIITIKEDLQKLQSLLDYNESEYFLKYKNNKFLNKKVEIIDTQYSTGVYNSDYQYEYSYIDIYDYNLNLNDDKSINNQVDEKEYDIPDYIIFGIYDSDGVLVDKEDVPWSISNSKYYGWFEQYDDNVSDNDIRSDIKKIVMQIIPDRVREEIPQYETVLEKMLMTINIKDAKKHMIDGAYLKQIFEKNGIETPIPKKSYKPKEIIIESKRAIFGREDIQKVWVDPESDYDLKVIKVEPKSSGDNIHLEVSTEIARDSYYGYPDREHRQNIYDTNWYYIEEQKSKKQQRKDKKAQKKGTYIEKEYETYYIVEGIRSDIDFSSGKKEKRKYYNITDYRKLYRKFILILIDIFGRLLPNIEDMLLLFKSPYEFISNIIIKKLGDNNGTESPKFLPFSKIFINEYYDMNQNIQNIKNKYSNLERDPSKKVEFINYAKEYINLLKKELLSHNILKNYFYYVDDKIKFVYDGASSIELFGNVFGIVVNFPTIDFFIKKIPNIKSNEEIIQDLNLSKSYGNKILLSTIDDGNIDNIAYYTKISEKIIYSTGEYDERYTYEYVYLTEEEYSLVEETNSLLTKYNLIYDNGEVKLKNNDILRVDFSDDLKKDLMIMESILATVLKSGYNSILYKKLQQLKSILGPFTEHPILSILLSMVVMPIKLVKKVVEYIMVFFKKLTNPFTLADSINDFISFKWFFNIFSLKNVLDTIGIFIDFEKIKNIIKGKRENGSLSDIEYEDKLIKAGLNVDNFPQNVIDQVILMDDSDDIKLILQNNKFKNGTIINYSKIVNIIIGKNLNSTKFLNILFSSYPNLLKDDVISGIFLKNELKRLLGVFKFLKEIIKAILDFIWSILGLKKLRNPPELDILSDNDITIIEGILSDNIENIFNNNYYKEENKSTSSTVLYDIKSDNLHIQNLNKESLIEWIEANRNNYKIVYL